MGALTGGANDERAVGSDLRSVTDSRCLPRRGRAMAKGRQCGRETCLCAQQDIHDVRPRLPDG